MNVYDITLREIGSNGKPIFMLFETDIPSMAAMVEQINSGRLVHGYRLFHRPIPGEPGMREVHDAREEAILLADVQRITHPRWRLVRFEDEVEADAS